MAVKVRIRDYVELKWENQAAYNSNLVCYIYLSNTFGWSSVAFIITN